MNASLKHIIILLSFFTYCISLFGFNKDIIANQKGLLYEGLPDAVKNSGKLVTLKMSECPEPIIAIIHYYYKVGGLPFDGLEQIIQFDSKNQIQTVNILPPANPKNAKFLITIMPKSTWPLLIEQAELIEFGKSNGENLRSIKLGEQIEQNPNNILIFEYVDIQPNQVITLPYAAANKPKIDQLLQNVMEESDVTLYAKLKPFLDQQPGKKLLLTITPPITEPIMISIYSGVTKPNGNTTTYTQIVKITPDMNTIEIRVTQPPSDKKGNINFLTQTEKLYQKRKTSGIHNVFPYKSLTDNQTIILPNPTTIQPPKNKLKPTMTNIWSTMGTNAEFLIEDLAEII